MIIVEFCGNPGSGKTTFCDEIEKTLQERGYRVRNLQKRKYPVTIFDKLAVVIKRFLFCSYSPNRKLKEAIKILEQYMPTESLINWPERILESFYRIKRAEKAGIEIGLFDEGCIQFITSVFHGSTVTGDVASLVEVLKEEIYCYNTLLIDCRIGLEDNIRRLVERNRPNDRFLQGSEQENMDMLSQKRKNIDTLLDMLKSQDKLVIEMQSTTNEEAIRKVIDTICEKISA